MSECDRTTWAGVPKPARADWEAAGGDDERQSLFRRAHERASRWRKRWQRASARCGCYHQERNKYRQRADAAEQRAMEERARAEAAEKRVAELESERSILTDRGIAVSERVCSSCGRHMLAYGGGDTICPECNARGRVTDLEMIHAAESRCVNAEKEAGKADNAPEEAAGDI